MNNHYRKGWKCPACGDLDGTHINGCRFSPPYDTDNDIRAYYQRHAPLPTASASSRHQWCRYSGPGRGDCEHSVGVPTIYDETTTDEYGIPNGWCDYCWASFRLRWCESRIIELEEELRA